MRNAIAITVAAGLLAGCSFFGVRSGYEQPSYEVVAQLEEDLEIRRYAPRLAAEARVEAGDEEDGRNAAFRLLFDYITGENRARAEISMTAPVESAEASRKIDMTVPVETVGDDSGTMVMRFFLPAAFDAKTAPEPLDPRVRIVELPAQTVATLRFTGLRGEERVAAKKEALLMRLGSSVWEASGDPVAFFYDPPWTLPFLRRNEVAVTVVGRAS